MVEHSLPATATVTAPRYAYACVSVNALMPEYWSEWTYAIPPEMHASLAAGQLVWVPLRGKLALGIVVAFSNTKPDAEIKPLHACVEPTFCLSAVQLNLAVWMSERYCCSVYDATKPMLPPGVDRRTVEVYGLTATGRIVDLAKLTKMQRAVVERLIPCDDESGLTLEELRAALGGALTGVLAALAKNGLVTTQARVRHDAAPVTKPVAFVRAIPDEEREVPLNAPRQQQALDYLRRRLRLTAGAEGPLPPGAVTVAEFRKVTGIGLPILHALAERGLVEFGALSGDAPRDVQLAQTAPAPPLTRKQQEAWEAISDALTARSGETFLLHGVTGSGKTEVYLRAVAAALRQGRGAIVCVPEIALATQMVNRIQARFPGQVAVLHSELSDNRRFAAWKRLARGEAVVAIGPRSALFAPIADVGCIVVDEEHESAYKQGATPRYHARDVARELARLSDGVCILGSATPDLITYHAAAEGTIRYLTLPERVFAAVSGRQTVDGSRQSAVGSNSSGVRSTADCRPPTGLPPVTLVDMREERRIGNGGVFSLALNGLLTATHAKGEQSIILLNRRGMATFTQCRKCGHVVICPQCDVPLVYHADVQKMRCHRCDHEARPRQQCPACGASEVRAYGVGTERVEEEVRRLLPTARVLRWDADSVRREGGHESILRRLEAREVDVLVGTQMVAKGLDLAGVTAIGVVNGDTHLHLPDYRAAERTFQLLTQVAGRAGRRAPGRVIFQTNTPEHPAIVAAQRHDYAMFAATELPLRERLGNPPYRQLARFIYRHKSEQRAREEADRLAVTLARMAYREGHEDFYLVGPAPCFTAKVRGEYYWHVVAVAEHLTPILRSFPIPYGWTVDVDPVSLL